MTQLPPRPVSQEKRIRIAEYNQNGYGQVQTRYKQNNDSILNPEVELRGGGKQHGLTFQHLHEYIREPGISAG